VVGTTFSGFAGTVARRARAGSVSRLQPFIVTHLALAGSSIVRPLARSAQVPGQLLAAGFNREYHMRVIQASYLRRPARSTEFADFCHPTEPCGPHVDVGPSRRA